MLSNFRIVLELILFIMTVITESFPSINDPYREECIALDKRCHERAACVPDDYDDTQFECRCAAGWVGDGITYCASPSLYLSVAPNMRCINSTLNTCFLTSEFGGSLRMSVEPHGNFAETQWEITWYKLYQGLPPLFHSFREKLRNSLSRNSRVRIDETSSILTLSGVGDDDVYPNRYFAELSQTDPDDPIHDVTADIEAMELGKAEVLNPSLTRVYFMIEREPIALGPFTPNSPVTINLRHHLDSRLNDLHRLHYRWSSEGPIDGLLRDDHELAEERESTLSLNRLNEQQLGGVVRGVAYERNGRVPGRVMVAAQRFQLKEDESRICAGPLSERVCTCRQGYKLEGTQCKDIDECQETDPPCLPDAQCVNTEGSFDCVCPIGYHGDGITTCSDDNECLAGNPCHFSAVCTNTPGSFVCTCAEGYIGDGIGCTAVSVWSTWSSWSPCAETCGDSTRTRTRECTHPESGMICYGPPTVVTDCTDNPPCPVDGGWSAWSQWTPCTSSCDGRRQRVRVCDRPTPEFGGKFCDGDMYTVDVCSELSCPVPGEWAPWMDWSDCSRACAGTEIRHRWCQPRRTSSTVSFDIADVNDLDKAVCETGDSKESRQCSLVYDPADCEEVERAGPAWGEWLHWSHCSQTCGEGQRYRRRTCTGQQPSGDLPPLRKAPASCTGAHRQDEPCIERTCLRGRLGVRQRDWSYE